MHAEHSSSYATPLVGQLLLAAGLIDDAALRMALITQGLEGGRLGEVLVRGGHVSEANLAQVLSNQLSVAWVSLEHVEPTPELLRLLEAECAYRLMVMPVHQRRDKGVGGILYLAMEDPTDVDAMEEVSAITGMHVRPMIATPTDLRRAIALHYELRHSGVVPFQAGPRS